MKILFLISALFFSANVFSITAFQEISNSSDLTSGLMGDDPGEGGGSGGGGNGGGGGGEEDDDEGKV